MLDVERARRDVARGGGGEFVVVGSSGCAGAGGRVVGAGEEFVE